MKKKKIFLFILSTLFVISANCLSIFANEDMNGDMTIEEGAEEYKITMEDMEVTQVKENEILKSKVNRANPDGVYYALSVPVFQQLNGYYCGPATVKQVVHFLNGSSSSQETYASQLGTTSAGTDMTRIASVLTNATGRKYLYTSIGSISTWSNYIEYGMRNKLPPVMDINTNSVSAFPYRSSGHFVNASGMDTKSGSKVRITDPYGPGLGNRWYQMSDVYNANNNHFRKAIIY